MTYEELYNRWLDRSPAWFEIDAIYEYYMWQAESAGWDMPARWLISVEYDAHIRELPGMYNVRPYEKGDHLIAGIPVEVGKFDFKIAVVARNPHQCRVGDFVEPGTLPPRFGDRDTVYIEPLPEPRRYGPLPALIYREKRFFDGAGKVFSLWRRES